MTDLIQRQDALDAFGLTEKSRKYGGDHSGYDTRMLYEIQDVLESLPSAEPERKKGEWTEYKKSFGVYGQIYYQHDCCPNLYESPYHFCPNCGADMRGE